jgi:NAD(P)-dependent dehydrogenase (short-subunit alcohol dehydrogenase family)
MTKQCGQPDAGPAGNIAHRRVGTMLGDDVTRDRENLAAIFFASARMDCLDKRISDPYNWIGDPLNTVHVPKWQQRRCPTRRKEKVMGKLGGKVAVITGGATGIGLAAAKRFIEEGAFVFIFGRRQEALDAAVADLGPNARAVKGSVSDLADLDRLYAAVKAERGTLDIVFANAGAGSPLPLGEITAEHIDETFDTNVKGTIFTVQKALPLMGQGGSIILTGSSAGTTGAPAFSAYSASKAAVRNLARTWAEDLKGTGIRVNVLSPGPTATELAKEALGEEGQKVFASMNPLQRMADPAEIGAVAAFLASQDSSFMTASEVAVDGGLAQI